MGQISNLIFKDPTSYYISMLGNKSFEQTQRIALHNDNSNKELYLMICIYIKKKKQHEKTKKMWIKVWLNKSQEKKDNII